MAGVTQVIEDLPPPREEAAGEVKLGVRPDTPQMVEIVLSRGCSAHDSLESSIDAQAVSRRSIVGRAPSCKQTDDQLVTIADGTVSGSHALIGKVLSGAISTPLTLFSEVESDNLIRVTDLR